jgi:transcriptional regulator with XRE-family HTH domain
MDDLADFPEITTRDYEPEQVWQAAAYYLAYGTQERVADKTGIPATTIQKWRESEWWPSLINRAKLVQLDKLDATLSTAIDETSQELLDRIRNGDYVVLKRTDEDGNETAKMVRKPIGGKELAIIMAVSIDKRQLLRGLPTSISRTDGKLGKLAGTLRKIEQLTTVDNPPQDSLPVIPVTHASTA